jgi:hypothetical protein
MVNLYMGLIFGLYVLDAGNKKEKNIKDRGYKIVYKIEGR